MALRSPWRSRPGALRSWRRGERSTALVRQLLTIAGKSLDRPRPLDLATVLPDLTETVSQSVGPDVHVTLDVAEKLPTVRVSPQKLVQVLLALADNAKSAMPDGGTLEILARTVAMGPDAAGPVSAARPGLYVELVARDSGVGMTEAVQVHAFEPFFTTQPPEHNAGLGLTVVWGIVAEAGGTVQLASAPGRGTTVRILWPVDESSAAAAAAPPVQALPGHGREVLVVDDEPLLRKIVVRALQREGYRVRQADDGEQALHAIERDGPPDALLTDVLMPRMNGAELARRVRERWPRTRIVVMSGHTADALQADALDVADYTFLAKPFRLADLTRLIMDLLATVPP